jgi:hypothetical protein
LVEKATAPVPWKLGRWLVAAFAAAAVTSIAAIDEVR